MKKVNKILLGTALPFLGLSVAVPIIATSCSMQAATIVESKWKDLTSENTNKGLSLNDKKDELTWDILKDTTQADNPIPTLEDIKNVILESSGSNNITEILKKAIIDYDKFQHITLEGNPIQNINDKIATFNILLSRKDGLEISRLKLVVKNYLIDATWSNKATRENVAHLSNNGQNINVDLKNVETSNAWNGLDKTKNKNDIETAIWGSDASSKTLQETFKKLIDQEKIPGSSNDSAIDKYNKFDVSIEESNDTTKNISFLIKISNSDASKEVKEQSLRIIIKYYI